MDGTLDPILFYGKQLGHPCYNPGVDSQIREQMSGPDLHVFTLKFLALKKGFFSCFLGQKKFKIFSYEYYATFQCGHYSVFKKKIDPEKVKKRASKVAHNWPNPFFHSPARPQPTAQN